jgi:hypothetical protein
MIIKKERSDNKKIKTFYLINIFQNMAFWRVRRGPSFLFIGNPALELQK